MTKTKKRKKSLVGYTHLDWSKFFYHYRQVKSWNGKNNIQRIAIPTINRNKLTIGNDQRFRKQNIKVKITIEEL